MTLGHQLNERDETVAARPTAGENSNHGGYRDISEQQQTANNHWKLRYETINRYNSYQLSTVTTQQRRHKT
jgi:hypothetical protein